MSIQNSIVRGSGRSSWRVAGLALGAALLMGASARADGDFENGFEDQMGRLLAFEAVQAAKAVLFYGAPVPVAVPAPYVAPTYYPPVVEYSAPTVVVGWSSWWPWYSAPRGHDHGHHHRHYAPPRPHRHDRYCGHGGYDRGRSYGGYRGDHRGGGYGYRDRDDDRGKGRGHGPSHRRARGQGDSRSRYARR